MSKLFIPILIPAGIEKIGDAKIAFFTIWFQLNANHEIFAPEFTGPVPADVLKDIKSLPLFINRLKGKEIVLRNPTNTISFKAKAIVKDGHIVSTEGLEFYAKFFGTVVTENKILEASRANLKYNNPSFSSTVPIRSVFFNEKPIGPLLLDTPIKSRLDLHNERIKQFNQLNENIRSYAEINRRENENNRSNVVKQISDVLRRRRDLFHADGKINLVNTIEEIDSYLSVAPAYVRKAFDALTENVYTQYLTGIFTKVAVDLDELIKAFHASSKLSLQVGDFVETELNRVCLDPREPGLLPTCLRLVEKTGKCALLLDTYPDPPRGTPNNFPYNNFFENTFLKSVITKNGSPTLSNHENAAKLFSERTALMKAFEMVKSQDDDINKATFNSLLEKINIQVTTKRGKATKSPFNPATRLQAGIDYLDYCKSKAVAAEGLRQSINAGDEKLTAGLTLVHPQWQELIKPETEEECFREHTLTKGFAVAIKEVKPEDGMPHFLSLTRRKEFLTIHRKEGNTTTQDDDQVRFGSISVDALMNAVKVPEDASSAATVHLTDNVLFTWLGGSLGLKNPNRGHEDDQQGDGDTENDIDLETQVLSQRIKQIFGVDFFPFLKRKTIENKPRGEDFFFLNMGIDKRVKLPRLLFSNSRSYQFLFYAQYVNGWQLPVTSDLLGGGELQLTVEEIIKEAEGQFKFEGDFTRNEHLKKVKLFYTENIINKNSSNKENEEGKEGESLKHLVIRTGKAGQISSEICSRHILPPESTLQMAQWHGKFREGAMTVNDVHQWHLKYHCRLKDQAGFKNKGCINKCDRFCGNHHMEEIYTNSFIYPNYLPDPLAEGFKMQFYRDAETSIPAIIYGYEEVICRFAKGRYPGIKSWRLVLKDGNISYQKGSKVRIDEDDQVITVYLPQGLELYVKITSVSFKDLDDAIHNKILLTSEASTSTEFKKSFSNLASEEEFGDGSQRQDKMPQEGAYFESFPDTIILTHAVQQPLMRPQILDVQLKKFRPEGDTTKAGVTSRSLSSVQAILELRFEMLNIVRCYLIDHPADHFTYINRTQPTGDLELWGKWEDYADNPHISYKPLNAGDLERLRSFRTPRMPQVPLEDEKNNFKFLGKVRFEELANMESLMHRELDRVKPGTNLDFTAFKTKVTVDFDIEKTQATSFIFQIRNSSKWNGFFPAQKTPRKQPFQLVSEEFRRILPSEAGKIKITYEYDGRGQKKEAISDYYLNNQKPQKPIISRIIPLIVTDETKQKNDGKNFKKRTTRYNRFRIFMKRNKDSLLTASCDERIAFILNSGKKYQNYFEANQFISRVGTDWITDTQQISNKEKYLTLDNFKMERQELEDPYIENFDPQPFKDPFIELVHYYFQFDSFRNNWYFDVEIDFKDEKSGEFHNAFLQLGLATFYEPGCNYSTLNDKDPSKDFRLSEVEKTSFISLLPSRTVTARLYRPNLFRKQGLVEFSLECNLSSLFFDKKGELRCQIYASIRETYRDTRKFIPSDFLHGGKGASENRLFHPLLNQSMMKSFEVVEGNKISTNLVSLEFNRDGLFGHKYELVIVEMENYLPDVVIDFNNPEFFKLPGQRIKYVEVF